MCCVWNNELQSTSLQTIKHCVLEIAHHGVTNRQPEHWRTANGVAWCNVVIQFCELCNPFQDLIRHLEEMAYKDPTHLSYRCKSGITPLVLHWCELEREVNLVCTTGLVLLWFTQFLHQYNSIYFSGVTQDLHRSKWRKNMAHYCDQPGKRFLLLTHDNIRVSCTIHSEEAFIPNRRRRILWVMKISVEEWGTSSSSFIKGVYLTANIWLLYSRASSSPPIDADNVFISTQTSAYSPSVSQCILGVEISDPFTILCNVLLFSQNRGWS